MQWPQISKQIKTALKSRKITYKNLAKQMGLSESGVKKLLNGKDIPLSRLMEICDILEFAPEDLLSKKLHNPIKDQRFTLNQEHFLMDHPKHLILFWKLTVQHKSKEQCAKEMNLDADRLWKYLLDLDKNNLIEVDKNKSIRFHDDMFVRWKGKGPLMDHILKEWSKNLISKSIKNKKNANAIHRLIYLQLTSSTQKELVMALNELADDFLKRSLRERLLNDRSKLNETGLLIAADDGDFVF
jgi:DNA-binding Xre family transcriptional regulator